VLRLMPNVRQTAALVVAAVERRHYHKLLGIDRDRASTLPATALSRGEAGPDPLPQRPLELRQSTEDMEQEFALRRGGVHLLGQRNATRVLPVTAARHCPTAAGALLGGIPWLAPRGVLALSAYATKMGRSLVPADKATSEIPLIICPKQRPVIDPAFPLGYNHWITSPAALDMVEVFWMK
jgi:hypothetical protein